MINLKVNDADRILTIEMKGMISEADIDGAIDAFQAQYPAVGVPARPFFIGRPGWVRSSAALNVLEGTVIGRCA